MEKKILDLLNNLKHQDWRALARAITIVENELEGHFDLLKSVNATSSCPIIGITGPPGAGKSTLVNVLILELLKNPNNHIGVIAIDPTSPFNYGSLLGDRIRMGEHFNEPRVFIRSLATRGSLGGLSAKTIEIVDVMQLAGFSHIIVETVGVGQSEVEIVGLADTTILVLVPEAGDEVQTIKSGIMEIADIFVVNKSDRPGSNTFVGNLAHLIHKNVENGYTPKIVKTIASKNEGVEELLTSIELHLKAKIKNPKKVFLLADKAFELIKQKKMQGINKKILQGQIDAEMKKKDFNLYEFIDKYY